MIAAAVYGARYVSDRFLPDKAIDLVDEAASALRLAQESKPEPLDALEREITTLQIELASLANESDPISVERRARVEETLKEKGEAAREMGERWKEERKGLGERRSGSGSWRRRGGSWRLPSARDGMSVRGGYDLR